MFLAVMVIVAVGYLSYRSLTAIVRSFDTAPFPDFTSLKIKEISNHLENAENSVRIYTITHDEKYLHPFYSTVTQVTNEINQLKTEKVNDTSLVPIIDTISMLINEKLLVWNDILVLYKNSDIEKKLKAISSEIDSVWQDTTAVGEKTNLLNRIFSKKKKLEEHVSKQQAILKKIDVIRSEKESTDERIEDKELKLAKTSTQITNKLYEVIAVLEKNESLKIKQKTWQAEVLSRKTFNWIASFSLFGTLLALLALIILTRFLKKSNAYQQALKESKQAAEELVKAKELFVANVSHELRTPLNAISGFTEQLISSPVKNDEYLSIIKSSTEHLMHLINELLDYSKLMAGKLQLEPDHFNLHVLVSDILSMFKIQAKKNKVRLSGEIGFDVPEIWYGDAFRLKQIMINLLSNAIKFSIDGKVKLSINSQTTEDNTLRLIVEVTDTGIGIEKEKLQSIFDDFTQEEADTSRKFGGTGLGLSIVKKLVELHQGEIHVQSEKNKGSVFTCTLLYKTGDAERIKKSADKILAPDLTRAKVLIVDDAEYNRKLLKVILNKWGAVVHEAENGMAAIQHIKRTEYDLVFLDVRMPVLDGFKTVKFIRKGMNKNGTQVPVYVMSAVSYQEKSKLSELDINGFILKPVSEENIKNLLLKSGKFNTQQVNETNTPITHTANNDNKLLDLTELNRLANNDSKFVVSMLKILIEQTNIELFNLERALDKSDWENISNIAHKIASPFKHVGKGKILNHIKDLEHKAKTKEDIMALKEIAFLFEQEYDMLKKEIELYLSSVNA